jgi:hypothetical protein
MPRENFISRISETISEIYSGISGFMNTLFAQPVFWPIFYIGLGAIFGLCGNFIVERWRSLKQRKISRMQVATNLRHWMNRAVGRVYETITWVESDGAGGGKYKEVPNFRFENSLEQVSLLDGKTARRVFTLIHAKDEVNDEIEGECEYGDDDHAVDLFRGRTAKLILDALGIYDDIATKIHWSQKVLSDSNVKKMKSEVERLDQIEKRQAEFRAELFSDGKEKGSAAT